MAEFKCCYIRNNETYEEIPYTELFNGKKRNPKYADRYFLPLHGCLLEVSYENYKKEYREKRRQKYIREEARQHGEVSYHALGNEDMNGEEIIRDIYTDVECEAIARVLGEKLRQALRQLNESELELIKALYFYNQTERQYADILGISQKGVNKRRQKVLSKLKALIEKN